MGTISELVARCALVGAVAVAACGGEGNGEGSGTGVVRGIDAANAQITLEHGDIPGLMKAMTMTFEIADPKLLGGVEIGSEVDFRVRYANSEYTVTDLDRR